MNRLIRPVMLATTCLFTSGCFFLLLMAPKTTADALPDRPGKAVYVKRCGMCHSLIEPTSFRHRLGEVLDRYGDQKIITNAEKKALTEYLVTFPDNRGRMLPAPTPTPTPAPPEASQPAPSPSESPSAAVSPAS